MKLTGRGGDYSRRFSSLEQREEGFGPGSCLVSESSGTDLWLTMTLETRTTPRLRGSSVWVEPPRFRDDSKRFCFELKTELRGNLI